MYIHEEKGINQKSDIPFPLVALSTPNSKDVSLELKKQPSSNSGNLFFKYSLFFAEPTVVKTLHP